MNKGEKIKVYFKMNGRYYGLFNGRFYKLTIC